MKKKTIIWLHIILWAAFLLIRLSNSLIPFLLLPIEKMGTTLAVIRTSSFLFIPLCFYCGYFLFLKIKNRKKTIIYSIGILIILLLVLFFVSKTAFAFVIALLSSTWWLLLGFLSRLGVDWFQQKQNIALLEKENTESKLAVLRNQINPHFLFNTLNNIDSLIKENQDKASQSLISLSGIMRYMLDESAMRYVPLKKELAYIKDYVSLEQLRLKNPEFVSLHISGNAEGKEVAPMLFIPFVENAFKHSIDSKEKDGIKIDFVIEDNRVLFSCENKFSKQPTEKDASHGVGLETVQTRLQLIYPKKHTLVIDKIDNVYKVLLIIDLNEN